LLLDAIIGFDRASAELQAMFSTWNGPPTYGDDPFDSFKVKWEKDNYNKWLSKHK